MAVPHPDIDFRSMNRRTRTVALVGYYLQRWARMEIEIDSAISTALRLNGTQKYIIIPNIAFHHKIQLLGALINQSLLSKHGKLYTLVSNYHISLD